MNANDTQKKSDVKLSNDLHVEKEILDDLVNGMMGCSTSNEGYEMKMSGVFYTWQRFTELLEEIDRRFMDYHRQNNHNQKKV